MLLEDSVKPEIIRTFVLCNHLFGTGKVHFLQVSELANLSSEVTKRHLRVLVRKGYLNRVHPRGYFEINLDKLSVLNGLL
jgi:hypothetical protein